MVISGLGIACDDEQFGVLVESNVGVRSVFVGHEVYAHLLGRLLPEAEQSVYLRAKELSSEQQQGLAAWEKTVHDGGINRR